MPLCVGLQPPLLLPLPPPVQLPIPIPPPVPPPLETTIRNILHIGEERERNRGKQTHTYKWRDIQKEKQRLTDTER